MTEDKSDNIEGIYLLGEKTLVKFFPEILEKPISYTLYKECPKSSQNVI